MNKHDELSGTLVLVHPQLLTDPAEKKNQIGIIASAEIENDNVVVSFGSEGQALFSADALLVLKKPGSIHFDTLRDHLKMNTQDFKDLLKVGMLANSNLTKDHRQAIEISRDNPVVLEYSMASLEEELGLKQDYSVSR
ncbi:hypothetical protein SNE25_13085 [Mucilaginibacter sabulilitoris]|uniref:Uncharacterized protein n=1 Tax=Mucilaginibacter sabulilitoris TaxID=1173583 RepID=A0ABZ0TYA7_9SPHI|nr:hypothetical protein [Mucilaginibacter sabulilitoris]WPU96455.1 hypothetical protein SNE25_13085 [Mucilaginibacter sabulilitoris]